RPPGGECSLVGRLPRAGQKSHQNEPADGKAPSPEDSGGRAGGPVAFCENPPIHIRIQTGFPASFAPRRRSVGCPGGRQYPIHPSGRASWHPGFPTPWTRESGGPMPLRCAPWSDEDLVFPTRGSPHRLLRIKGSLQPFPDRRKAAAVKGGWSPSIQRSQMIRRRVSLVLIETVLGIAAGDRLHPPVPLRLGHDGGRGDGMAVAVPLDNRLLGKGQ